MSGSERAAWRNRSINGDLERAGMLSDVAGSSISVTSIGSFAAPFGAPDAANRVLMTRHTHKCFQEARYTPIELEALISE